MNLAAIIIQLVSFCNVGDYSFACRDFMVKCANKHYNTQQVEKTEDYCVKQFLNR